jgi:hypothetical protein
VHYLTKRNACICEHALGLHIEVAAHLASKITSEMYDKFLLVSNMACHMGYPGVKFGELEKEQGSTSYCQLVDRISVESKPYHDTFKGACRQAPRYKLNRFHLHSALCYR